MDLHHLHPPPLPTSASSVTEFVAHGGSVTCLCFGPKSGHIFATGSDDKNVNVWSFPSLSSTKGNSANFLTSLSGSTSSIEAVKFGRNEDIIAAGCISGSLKVWDLESAQTLRSFSGHKSSVTFIDFHPYGDFFASGSLDSNIKLWDTRKKSCMYAYKVCIESLSSPLRLPASGATFGRYERKFANSFFFFPYSRHVLHVRHEDIAWKECRDWGELSAISSLFSEERTDKRLLFHSFHLNVDVLNGISQFFSSQSFLSYTPSTLLSWRAWSLKQTIPLKEVTRCSTSTSTHNSQCLTPFYSRHFIFLFSLFPKLLQAHSKDVRCLRFSPDGRWLASGGDEGIIKVTILFYSAYPQSTNSYQVVKCNTLVLFVSSFFFMLLALTHIPFYHLPDFIWLIVMEQQYEKTKPDASSLSSPVTNAGDVCLFECWIIHWSNLKVWDLAAGKVLAEFNEHVAPVTDLSFHPNELLLTSSSMDGTVKFWDLEAFTQVSSTANEAGPVHTITYNLDGTLLFACARDLLKTFQWEPARTVNTLIVNWGRVKDTFITDHFMITASATTMSVAVFIVCLGKKSPASFTTKALASLPSAFQSNLSFSPSPSTTLNSATSLTNLSTVPSTAMINAAAAGLAHSSSHAFLPSHHLSHQHLNLNTNSSPSTISQQSTPPQRLPPIKTPPKAAVVFPEPQVQTSSAKNCTKSPPSDSKTSLNSKSDQSTLSLFPTSGRDLNLNTNKSKPVQNVAPSKSSAKVSTWNTNHHQKAASTCNLTSNSNKANNSTTKAAAIIFPEQKKKPMTNQSTLGEAATPSPPTSSDEKIDMIPESRDRPAGLDFDDFLPKHLQDTVRLGYHPQPEISETEAMTSIMKGHKSLVTALSHRKKNVQIVLALWSAKDPVKALEQAIHFDDQSIIVDILNVINLKP